MEKREDVEGRRRRFVMIISMRESKMDKEIAFFFLFVHRWLSYCCLTRVIGCKYREIYIVLIVDNCLCLNFEIPIALQ